MLNDYVIVRKDHRGGDRWVRVTILYDPNPEDPRDWDNLGTMVCFHKRYNLGDDDHGFETPHQFREFLEDNEGKVLVLPLYLMDHSGLSLSTSDTMFRMVDSVGWDWGQVGWIYVTYDKIREWFGVRRVTKQVLERAVRALEAEVEEYNKYLNGDVLGFVIEEHDPKECWKVVDSCFGFYDIEHLLEYVPDEYRELTKQAWDERD